MLLVQSFTYKNVPPENKSSMPVHQLPDALSILPPPISLTNNQVERAPTGAARLNTIKWARAARFDKPCFRSTDVRPNAAGAL